MGIIITETNAEDDVKLTNKRKEAQFFNYPLRFANKIGMPDDLLQAKTVVLIVEDDKFLRTLLSEKLKREGIFVVEAQNGGEALVKMKDEPRPHLILLDLLLPVVDGFEVLRRMRDDQDLKRIPVLVLSNLGQKEDIQRAKDLGAVDYMVKAYFTPGEIVEKIRRIIREEYV